MKKFIALVMIPALLLAQCKEMVQPEAPSLFPQSRYTPGAIEAIKLGAIRANAVMKQYKPIRTKIPRSELFNYSISEYRNQITDPAEKAMYDEITKHQEFKKLSEYMKTMATSMGDPSNGRTATTYWDEDDYYVSEDAKGWISWINSDLQYIVETSPYYWSSSELLYACYDKLDDFAEALDTTTDLTQYDKDLLWPGVWALYSTLPGQIDEYKSYPPEARTQGRWGNIFGSAILHMFIAVVVITAVVLVVAATMGTGAAAAAILSQAATISIGGATFSTLSITIGAGMAAGAIVTAGMAANDQCLDSYGGMHYESCYN
jgi:hypothetical protein